MYKEDDRFEAPPADAILWRYMSFTKFVSLLTRKALFFARADKLGDPFEGSLTPLNVALRPFLMPKSIPEEKRNVVADAIKDMRRFMLINSWHENEYESDAMWKLYSGIEDGIAIKTDFGSFSESLKGPHSVYIGRVNYIDYDSSFIAENDVFMPFIHKRKSFEHEREVRAIIMELPTITGKGFQIGIDPAIHELGLYHDVDTAMLIKEVVVPPYAADWLTELVKATAETFGLEATVRKSSLATRPVWR